MSKNPDREAVIIPHPLAQFRLALLKIRLCAALTTRFYVRLRACGLRGVANLCPMFYVETQSDLAKEGSDRGTPEELVRKLANKFPDFSGSPNAHHAAMCAANLLGEEIPLRGQVILPRGCQATVSGHRMAI